MRPGVTVELMPDHSVVALCAQCLAEAAAFEGSPDDLALTVVALARDLADTQRAEATILLDLAWSEATVLLDGSDLEADSFAGALDRLTVIRAGVRARLASAEAGPDHPHRQDPAAPGGARF